MGRFATGVTIITAVGDDGAVHGMTVNGFMSVSLSPPLVLISLGDCRMAKLLPETQRYGVSILADEQRSFSQHFAGQDKLTISPEFEWHDGMAFIAEAVAHIGAEVVDIHTAGDHTLFIGEVSHLATSDGRPLIFHGGSYELLRNQEEQEIFFV
ncbi:flavin reductase family protein [Nitriliruptor alkaliphilus]|uniref:flavin reductase family protein n=1 Tax=Nitriliruptor alkaliphilus TaxID=427918 RepID=UPI001B8073AA|nr:flavin reductase family protein [Nitriliruptor alkaliphilus]